MAEALNKKFLEVSKAYWKLGQTDFYQFEKENKQANC